MRHCGGIGPDWRVLELGPGVGANVSFFLDLGVEYHAVEGSERAVGGILDQWPELSPNVARADFTTGGWGHRGDYDLVVDRSAITHNDSPSIERTVEEVSRGLRPGGHYIGVDWWAPGHSAWNEGRVVDRWTRTGYRSGPFAGVGAVGFSDAERMWDLFDDFHVVSLEHKSREQVTTGERVDAWDIVARKPEAV